MGTVVVLYLISKRAKEWADQNINYEDYQKVGENGIAIEWRFIGSITGAMKDKGFRVGEDYTLWEG